MSDSSQEFSMGQIIQKKKKRNSLMDSQFLNMTGPVKCRGRKRVWGGPGSGEKLYRAGALSNGAMVLVAGRSKFTINL